MPELLRLQTPDFEFSVWANDISGRIKVHQATVAKRAGLIHDSTETLTAPHFELRFSPAAELVDVAVFDGQAGCQPAILATPVTAPEKCSTLPLNTPLFFENTQYQFEWVFFGPVSNARLLHRSQSLSEAFRFSAQRGPLPARLTGSVNTGNDVGWLRLPLLFELEGKTHTQHIAFEVLPTKMLLHQDLAAMYQAIDAIYPLWRFSVVEKTEQDAATSKQQGHFPLMWLAQFAALRARFEQGLKVICAAPHRQLQPSAANTKAAKLKGRIPHTLAERVRQDFANGQYDKGYRVEKKHLSVDTPENRFIKMAVSQCKKQLTELETKLRASNQAPEHQRLSDDFLNELHRWQHPLHKTLSQSFLKEVGSYTGLTRESLVLQQKTGYSTVYRVWQELKFYLDAFGNQSSISMKSVAKIYEIWCFLCLKHILEQDLGFQLLNHDALKVTQNDFFEYQLTDGLAGAFRFKRADGVSARLVHEPRFTPKGQPIRSFLVNQEPDIVLEVSLPAADPREAKQFIWLFDAKYRIKTDANRWGDTEKNSAQTDYVPDDALNQMHRYRDALIRLSPSESTQQAHPQATPTQAKSRPVFGAFALYPGFFDQATETNPYADAIDEVSIGAFALLPTPAESPYCGHTWLLEFLRAQIGSLSNTQTGIAHPLSSLAERLYVQESARIPYQGMRQGLYPDLTLTVALGGQRGRCRRYFEHFEQGTAQWYHLPQSTFLGKFGQHIAQEIRYLALASTSEAQSSTKQIDKLWPVKGVSVVPRCALSEEQAGRVSCSEEAYYLFELGKPLRLQTPVTHVPHRPIKHSMKLTTLTRLENGGRFAHLERVYEGAILRL